MLVRFDTARPPQYELGADFYFIRITQYTDKMMSVLQNNVSAMFEQEGKTRRSARLSAKKRDFSVHDLGKLRACCLFLGCGSRLSFRLSVYWLPWSSFP